MNGSRARRALLPVLLAVLLTGCITVGRTFRPDAIELIQMGSTTKAQILDMLGTPWRTGEEDGLETWTYGHYRYSAFGASRTRDLVVRFNDRDILVSYTYNTTTPGP